VKFIRSEFSQIDLAENSLDVVIKWRFNIIHFFRKRSYSFNLITGSLFTFLYVLSPFGDKTSDKTAVGFYRQPRISIRFLKATSTFTRKETKMIKNAVQKFRS